MNVSPFFRIFFCQQIYRSLKINNLSREALFSTVSLLLSLGRPDHTIWLYFQLRMWWVEERAVDDLWMTTWFWVDFKGDRGRANIREK